MRTIRVYDVRGALLCEFANVPDNQVLDRIGDAMEATGDTNQTFNVRVENERGSGYWMVIGSRESLAQTVRPA